VKVHLVDGTYELFRAFYAVPEARDADGRPVNALRGLVATLLSLVHEPGVSHVAVAFDHVIESFRNELYDGYKTGDGVEPDLLAQFHPAEAATAALGIVVWSMVEFEADDALAAGAHRFKDEPGVEQVVICSPDKDLSQCVAGSRVICRDRRRQLDRDAAGVVARFGVPPESLPDWLALVGDTADGYPGIAGWGEKTAAAVLARHLHLEAIPDDPALWGVELRGRERLAATLRAGREQALLYRRLATLRTDVPLAESLEDLEWRGARRGELSALCNAIGAPELLERVRRWRAD
jgi:5'-3' exonuclease